MSVFINLESLLRVFGAFEGSSFQQIDALSLFDGGTESAYENYALLDSALFSNDESETGRLVDLALDFFSGGSRSHIWPLFAGAGKFMENSLTARGGRLDSVFFDMAADTAAMDFVSVRECEIHEVTEKVSARKWADAAWYGFDSDEPAPDSFVRFAASMAASPDIKIYSLVMGDSEIASTGMLAIVGGTAGIYYVATRPEFRGEGLAMSMMKRLMIDARDMGYEKISLLATPSGAPLYKKCSFADVGEVPIIAFGE